MLFNFYYDINLDHLISTYNLHKNSTPEQVNMAVRLYLVNQLKLSEVVKKHPAVAENVADKVKAKLSKQQPIIELNAELLDSIVELLEVNYDCDVCPYYTLCNSDTCIEPNCGEFFRKHLKISFK